MEEIVNLHVKLYSSEKKAPVTGETFTVVFYDKDPVNDDFLGESSLDSSGHAIVSVTRNKFRSVDAPWEKHPDVYFELLDGNSVVFKSHVFKDLDLSKASDFGPVQGMNIDLGTFAV